MYNSRKIRVLENFNGYGFRVRLNNCKLSTVYLFVLFKDL